MKLTAFSRFLIVLIIVGIVGYFGYQFYGANALHTNDQTEVVENEKPESSKKEEAKTVSDERPKTADFDFMPPAPQGGQLTGVVELGASGFNSFIITLDKQNNWKLEKAEFGASLVYENMATEQDVREGLKKYIAGMLEYGVSGRNIHFMVSSSAIKTPEVQKIRQGLKSLNYVVNSVNATQEGVFAFMAAMPKAYQDKAFVVDIGSGNTKVSWMEGGQIKSLETYGSKYYQDNVTDEKVYKEVQAIANQVPASRREVCFMIGGAPFQMASESREGKERYTVLWEPDEYEADGAKMDAGINIYRALRDQTKGDLFIFDWDANFTIGFLLSLD